MAGTDECRLSTPRPRTDRPRRGGDRRRADCALLLRHALSADSFEGSTVPHSQSRLAGWQSSNRTSSSGGAAASAAGPLQGEGRRAAKGVAVEGGVGTGGNLTLELQF